MRPWDDFCERSDRAAENKKNWWEIMCWVLGRKILLKGKIVFNEYSLFISKLQNIKNCKIPTTLISLETSTHLIILSEIPFKLLAIVYSLSTMFFNKLYNPINSSWHVLQSCNSFFPIILKSNWGCVRIFWRYFASSYFKWPPEPPKSTQICYYLIFCSPEDYRYSRAMDTISMMSITRSSLFRGITY